MWGVAWTLCLAALVSCEDPRMFEGVDPSYLEIRNDTDRTLLIAFVARGERRFPEDLIQAVGPQETSQVLLGEGRSPGDCRRVDALAADQAHPTRVLDRLQGPICNGDLWVIEDD